MLTVAACTRGSLVKTENLQTYLRLSSQGGMCTVQYVHSSQGANARCLAVKRVSSAVPLHKLEDQRVDQLWRLVHATVAHTCRQHAALDLLSHLAAHDPPCFKNAQVMDRFYAQR